jgi:AraC family transcriptional regulator
MILQQAAEWARKGLMTVEAELHVPHATALVVCFNMTKPSDDILIEEDAYWLDMCLTPRHNARACYREHWNPDRFERIGDLFCRPAGEVLHAKGDCGRQDSIVCLLRTDSMRAMFDNEFQWTDRRLEASLDISSATIRSLMLRLGEEARHPGFASEILAELLAEQIVIELFRYCASAAQAPPTGGLAAWRLRIIDERLADHFAAPALAELAELCSISVRQLTRGFRASRGCSIGEYAARSQMEHAKRMLATGQSIQSIGHSLGFASHSAFSYAFKRATGQTPRDFRENHYLLPRAERATS